MHRFIRAAVGAFVVSLMLGTAATPAQAADPVCDPLDLGEVHSGFDASGAILCDDADGDPLTYTDDSAASHGFGWVDGAGAVSYSADSGYEGPDSWQVLVDDGTGGTATVDVTVEVVNDPPECADVDAGEVLPGEEISIWPDCADAENDTPSYAITTPPEHGTASVDGDSLVYEAPAGFTGTVTFQYAADDGLGTSAPATVTVEVVNTAPVCEGRDITLRTGKPLPEYVYCEDDESQPLTQAAVQQPSHGAVTFGDDGSGEQRFIYTPAAGYTGPDTFTVRAFDGTAYSEAVTVSLDVTPNHAPECDDTILHTGVADALEVVLWCDDTDAQDENALTYALAAPTPAHGTITDFDPQPYGATLTYTPTAGFTGADTFGYTVSDGQLTTAAAQRLHVADGPLCLALPARTVAAGAAFEVRPVCTRPPGDTGPLTLSIAAAPAKGTAAVNGGKVTYTAAAVANGADAFVVRASTASGHHDVTQAITVMGVAAQDGKTTTTGGTSSGGATTIPPDTAPPLLTAAVVKGQRLGRVLAKGLRVRATVSEHHVLRIVLTVGGRRATFEGAFTVGTATVSVKLPAKARRALKRSKSAKVRLTVTATDTAGNRTEKVLRVTLRR